MLRYHEKSKSYQVEGRKLDLQADLEGIHEKLASPVSDKDLDAWKTKLTAHALRTADYIAGELGKSYGYLPITKGGSFGIWLKKQTGGFSVFVEVFIKRFYHKSINIKTRRLIRKISHHTFKLFGIKNIFHPEGLKRT